MRNGLLADGRARASAPPGRPAGQGMLATRNMATPWLGTFAAV